MQRREIMRFEFKEQKEKAKVSECFTKQGVSDNAYCVKYYLHKKKTTSDNYDQIAHGKLYVLTSTSLWMTPQMKWFVV